MWLTPRGHEGPGHCRTMPNSRQKPAIPEPSLRFFVWSMVVGFLMIAVILAYMIWTGSGERMPAAKLNGHKPQHHSSLWPRTVLHSIL
jgi:hypothetical protein